MSNKIAFINWHAMAYDIYLKTRSYEKLHPEFLEMFKFFNYTYTKSIETILKDMDLFIDDNNINSKEGIFYSSILLIVYSNGNLEYMVDALKKNKKTFSDPIEYIVIRKLMMDTRTLEILWDESQTKPKGMSIKKVKSPVLVSTSKTGTTPKDSQNTPSAPLLPTGRKITPPSISTKPTEIIKIYPEIPKNKPDTSSQKPPNSSTACATCYHTHNVKFPFLLTPPPVDIFGSVLSIATQTCILEMKIFGDHAKRVNSMRNEDAWKYCDQFFMEFMDERRTEWHKGKKMESPIVKDLEEKLLNLKVPPASIDPKIYDVLKTILTKVNNLENQQLSLGNIKPDISIVAPPFIPMKDQEKPTTSHQQKQQQVEEEEDPRTKMMRLLKLKK